MCGTPLAALSACRVWCASEDGKLPRSPPEVWCLGTARLINRLVLEGVAFGLLTSLLLPEPLEEVHTMLLPLGCLSVCRAWRASSLYYTP